MTLKKEEGNVLLLDEQQMIWTSIHTSGLWKKV
jgi:hypothetical protein